MSKRHIKNTMFIVIVFLSDITAYLISFLFAYFTRIFVDNIFNITPLLYSFNELMVNLWWLPLIFIVMFAYKNLYTLKKPFWHESRRIFVSWCMTFLLVFSTISLGKMSDIISRLFIIFIFGYILIFSMLFRYILKTKILNKKLFAENVIIIGYSNYMDKVKSSILIEHGLCFNILGVVITKNKSYRGKQKILGNICDIESIIKEYSISSAIVIKNEVDKTFENTLNHLQIELNKLLVVLDSQGIGFSNTEAIQLLNTNLNYIQINNNFKSLMNSAIKRFSDIILSLLLLPFLLIVILFISLLIKMTSEGPVFYGHKRVGRFGKEFYILKFRSMYQDADSRLKSMLEENDKIRTEWNKYYKLKNDPRVTNIGKFLRKTSLDELPQIFNVLKGDMSFVGPRPVIQDELDKYYREMVSYYCMVRPGITGLWQISGRNELDYETRVAKDSWYVLNWSVWLDIVILFKTPSIVLQKKGAY